MVLCFFIVLGTQETQTNKHSNLLFLAQMAVLKGGRVIGLVNLNMLFTEYIQPNCEKESEDQNDHQNKE